MRCNFECRSYLTWYYYCCQSYNIFIKFVYFHKLFHFEKNNYLNIWHAISSTCMSLDNCRNNFERSFVARNSVASILIALVIPLPVKSPNIIQFAKETADRLLSRERNNQHDRVNMRECCEHTHEKKTTKTITDKVYSLTHIQFSTINPTNALHTLIFISWIIAL